jgi:hypothetical protein
MAQTGRLSGKKLNRQQGSWVIRHEDEYAKSLLN